ncbi:thiol-disulfide oxidoreductase DCC family protein [Priestia megaterium]|uniref:thiol-disulfide oxidoreductase DCC family protein n=1 Tax=Priestia megaterium TaxID=1404 RepID=UPI003F804C5C
MKVKKDNQPIIMFDGICNVCNHWVQFVIKRDPKGIFKFLSLQSDLARSLIINHNPNNMQLNSIILIDKGQIYTESTAILHIINKPTGPIRFFILFWIIPKKIRDRAYRFIAKNRYRFFGKKESCLVPSKEIQNRFIKTKIESGKINE